MASRGKMGVPKTLILAYHLLILTVHAVGQDDPTLPNEYQVAERDALYSLKQAFSHPFLNDTWTGLQCKTNTTDTTWFGISCFHGRVTGIFLDNLGLTGRVNEKALVNLTHLAVLSFRNNSIFGQLMDFSAPIKLKHVDLSQNRFTGPISSSLTGLRFLVSLQLQKNYLEGEIPAFSRSSLRKLDLSSNNLTGKIPPTPVIQSFDPSSYSNNPGLCGPPSMNPCTMSTVIHQSNESAASQSDKKKKEGFFEGTSTIAILAVAGFVFVAFMTYIFFMNNNKAIEMERRKELYFDKRRNEEKIVEPKEEVEVGVEAENKEERKENELVFMGDDASFELQDLLKSSAEWLGKGSFGSSYKALLANGASVVVKRLRDLHPLSSQEFAKQMSLLAGLRHPNLLPLIAYYHSKSEKLLLYRFAQNGNLFDRIHGGRGKNRIPFKWSSRLTVARGVARAISFLHRRSGSNLEVPHGNLKSSNVLLDENEEPLVSDYSLSLIIAPSVAVQHMVCYKSPEYQNRRKISLKTDVWSYGCLLLELITGRISIHHAPRGVKGVDLGDWVHKAVREEWTVEIFDLEITVQRSANRGVLQLLQIAVRCCDKSPEKRPTMAEVEREVEEIGGLGEVDVGDESSSLERSLTDESSGSIGSRSGRDERWSTAMS